jgi:putative SOS response-associated peptidase YedK
MCGRFAITLPPEAVRRFFRYVEQPNLPPRYNFAPTQPVAIVRGPRRRGRRRARRPPRRRLADAGWASPPSVVWLSWPRGCSPLKSSSLPHPHRAA